MLKTLLKISPQISVTLRGIKRYPNKNLNREFNNERKQIYREMTELRKRYRHQHWEEFTRQENKYIEEFEETEFNAWRSRETRFRSSVIKIAMHTQRHLDYLREREIRMRERNRKRQLLQGDQILTRKVMLDAMEIQSTMWLSNEKFLNNLNAGNLLPASIHKQADYLQKLQEKSLLIQMGDYSKLEDIMDRREIIAYKNKLLAPIFQEIKAAIRLMTYTEEYKILRQFQDLKNVIKAKHSGNTKESKRVLFELYLRHSQLLAKLHSEQNNPEVKLQVLEEQIDNIRAVLALWEYYTYIIYLPDSQVYGIMEMEAREEREEAAKSIKKIKERFEEAKLGDDAEYKSVLEEVTSDTSEAQDELSKKHEILKEDMIGEVEENDDLASFSEKELEEKLKEKSQKTTTGFQFKSKSAELGFISNKAMNQENEKEVKHRSKRWDFITKMAQSEMQEQRFNKDQATVVSGTSVNFLDRTSFKGMEDHRQREGLSSLKQEELVQMYEKNFLQSQSGSMYGDEEESQQVDKMVQEMNFQKLGLKQFMEAQSLDKLYDQHPNFDAYDRMRLHDTARVMVEEMNLMKESLSRARIIDDPHEMDLVKDDEKRGTETAHVSLVVKHFIKQLNYVKDTGLEAKNLAKKRSILKKLEAMKEIEILDPKILLEIHDRVSYKLPEFDLQ